MLKGTPYGISRDYPQEITHARQKLWPQYKAARENPLNRVTIGYPAKLIVNGVVVCDLFPEWNSVNKGSRISLIKQGDNQLDPIHNQSGLTRPTYAEEVNSATNGQHHNNSQSDALTRVIVYCLPHPTKSAWIRMMLIVSAARLVCSRERKEGLISKLICLWNGRLLLKIVIMGKYGEILWKKKPRKL